MTTDLNHQTNRVSAVVGEFKQNRWKWLVRVGTGVPEQVWRIVQHFSLKHIENGNLLAGVLLWALPLDRHTRTIQGKTNSNRPLSPLESDSDDCRLRGNKKGTLSVFIRKRFMIWQVISIWRPKKTNNYLYAVTPRLEEIGNEVVRNWEGGGAEWRGRSIKTGSERERRQGGDNKR